MKKRFAWLSSFAVALSTLVPAVPVGAVDLDLLSCQFGSQVEIACDLALKKEVKVNDGSYVDANTVADAVNAQVGDTVTWRITVSNNVPSTKPLGEVDVTDVLPSGVSFVSASGSTGTGSGTVWNFTVGGYEGGDPDNDYITNLPATLEIVTTATSVGVFENRADLSAYYCDGACEYEDGNTANNFDLAYVNISTKGGQVLGTSSNSNDTPPQVLAATTLAETGQSTVLGSVVAVSLIGSTLLLAYLTSTKKVNSRRLFRR